MERSRSGCTWSSGTVKKNYFQSINPSRGKAKSYLFQALGQWRQLKKAGTGRAGSGKKGTRTRSSRAHFFDRRTDREPGTGSVKV